jgi:tol-pal system protein YbgF
MTRMRASVALAAALFMVPSAAAAANKEQQLLMAELRMLQQHQQQLQQLVVALTDALKLMNGRLDEQTSTNRKALADQRLLVEGMTDNVRILRERADDTNVRLSSLSQELESIRQAIVSQPQPAVPLSPTAEPGADPAAGSSPASGPSSGTPTASAPPAGVSPQRTYDSAYSDYAAGHYDIAIEGFETFLRLFPRDFRSHDAQLNIGNALYNAGKFKEAVNAYQRVISDYPTSESVPTAHYKMGLSYMELKQPDLARKAFETVLTNHRGSRDEIFARQALDRLKKP